MSTNKNTCLTNQGEAKQKLNSRNNTKQLLPKGRHRGKLLLLSEPPLNTILYRCFCQNCAWNLAFPLFISPIVAHHHESRSEDGLRVFSLRSSLLCQQASVFSIARQTFDILES